MKKPTEIQSIDISRTLFMDLAFLLIAALVLLVQEPSKRQAVRQPIVDFSFVRIRSVSTKDIVEKDVPGESLFLYIQVDGSIRELLSDGTSQPIPLSELSKRITQMSNDGERAVVLVPDEDVLYAKVAQIRDILSHMTKERIVSTVYELIRGTHEH
jgi:biopolymer transport protein ExbD